MSVGMFLGVKPSFADGYNSAADKFLIHINRALDALGLSPYVEPTIIPNPYQNGYFGRSALDHQSASALELLMTFCGPERDYKSLTLLMNNLARVVFLPLSSSNPIETEYSEPVFGEDIRSIWIGALSDLREDLISLADRLEVPLLKNELQDEVAQRINDYECLSEEDGGDFESRTTWLMLYEGCRLALAFDTALSFAG